jgi:uncharacterized protein (TIGR00725 family)
MTDPRQKRRKVMAVVGGGSLLDADCEQLCADLGRGAVEAGFRLATGGLGGVMAAASRGAHDAEGYQEGDVVGILPGYDAGSANDHVDLAIPTGMGIARNVVLISTADVVVAVGGGSGTLSELALAWQLGKPIIGLVAGGGWAAKLAGEPIDDRRRDSVVSAETAAQAVVQAVAMTGG